ncbi:MAG: M1 family metallopeptidase [Tunicatimonas sp.]
MKNPLFNRSFTTSGSFLVLLFGVFMQNASAQSGYWQQAVDYQMEVAMDVDADRFTGKQVLTYQNNSPDTLTRVFYHLYFNAFQPGSMMDARSRTISDPDRRVGDRIVGLQENEIGYQRVISLTQDSAPLQPTTEETILVVPLAKPVLPGQSTTLAMEFKAQVPEQIRRSGRDNAEGIRYSMAQWYPKLAEYDEDGWHPNPYIGREFYGVWGSYDVKIAIPANYVVAATGVLQNPQEVGHGYADQPRPAKRKKGASLTYHFRADSVHDFVWAADPDYVHTTAQVLDGPLLHFFYQPDTLVQQWERLPELTVKAFQYMSKHFGEYPYPSYSVIQGGDGGMEYPMATLITGHRPFPSLVGVTVHELIHSWYQGVLGTNESRYPWMDEGFTTYATNRTMNFLFNPDSALSDQSANPQADTYDSYFALAASGLEEPMTTHADHYATNRAYGSASYSKGAVFLNQLSYIVGQQAFERGMRRYYNTWKFKHPDAHDFLRVMERESGLVLDWYLEYFVNSTRSVDYGIASVADSAQQTTVTLKRIGPMPMPLDVRVTYQDGHQELFYIPLRMMRGEKENEVDLSRTALADWPWTNPTYRMAIPRSPEDIKRIVIDPSMRLADVDRANNRYPADNVEN